MKLAEMHKLLKEGGNAAENMIPQLQKYSKKPLTYTKISQKDLGTVFDTTVREILDALKANGIIDKKYEPKYTLGSTRLAADIAGKPVTRYAHEDDLTTAKAKMQKQEFGDLDVDIEMLPGKSTKDVFDVLSKLDPERIAVRNAGQEANVAARIGDKVIQIDVVDMGGDRNRWEFQQSSSYADTAQNVKGMVHKVLLASFIQTMPLSSEDKIKMGELITKNPEIQKWISKGYKLTNMGRFLLGPKGVRVVVDMEKDGVKAAKRIDLEDKERIPISNLDQLAKFILQKDSATYDIMLSAVKMAEFAKNNNPSRVPAIWAKFNEKIHTIIADNAISPKDAANAFQVIGTHLGISPEDIAKAVQGIKG
jgi:hypothetical protein